MKNSLFFPAGMPGVPIYPQSEFKGHHSIFLDNYCNASYYKNSFPCIFSLSVGIFTLKVGYPKTQRKPSGFHFGYFYYARFFIMSTINNQSPGKDLEIQTGCLFTR